MLKHISNFNKFKNKIFEQININHICYIPLELFKNEFIKEYNIQLDNLEEEYPEPDETDKTKLSFKDTFYPDLDTLENKLYFEKDGNNNIIIKYSHIVNFNNYRLIIFVKFIFNCKLKTFTLNFNYKIYDIINNKYYDEETRTITLIKNTSDFKKLVDAFIYGSLYVGDITSDKWIKKYKRSTMKYLKEYYEFNKLDMPINSNFISYENYKNYLDNEEVFELVNQLNNLYWEMEQEAIDDETANEYAEEIEQLENELYETIKKLRITNKISEIEQADNAIINDFEQNLENIIDNYSIESTSIENGNVVILLNINDEEYEINIDSDGNAFLHDAEYIVPIGNIYEYNVGKILKNIISLYGVEYINYLKNNSIQ